MPKKKLPTKMSAGFGLSMLDRAIKESFAERCDVLDLERIEQFFSKNGRVHCAYCGSVDANRWDHLHAVSLGGDTVPGNLVPACSGCDDSKQNRTLEEWALSMSAKAPAKDKLEELQRRLEEYQRIFSYKPKFFLDKLSTSQREQYALIQSKLSELRELLVAQGFLRRKASKLKSQG